MLRCARFFCACAVSAFVCDCLFAFVRLHSRGYSSGYTGLGSGRTRGYRTAKGTDVMLQRSLDGSLRGWDGWQLNSCGICLFC